MYLNPGISIETINSRLPSIEQSHTWTQVGFFVCVCVFQAGLEDTFACTIRPTEHRALLDTSKRFKHFPYVSVSLLFPQHAHKELPVF